MRRRSLLQSIVSSALAFSIVVPSAFGWGRTGHLMINRIAAEKLPADVPAFLRSKDAIDEIEYLGPEPDRWKSPTEPELVSAQFAEHFLDLEWADLAGPLPNKRFDYIRALQIAQIQHPGMVLSPDKVGLLPYEIAEVWGRLKSAMRDYRALSAAHENTKPVEEIIIFYAGWLGHYVADGSQPLHVTIKYNGWVGPNPNNYTTDHTIHAKFESTYVLHNTKAADVASLVPSSPDPQHGEIFDDVMAYLRESNTHVETVYQLEKAGGFEGAGTPEAKKFTEERIAVGAAKLRDLIYYAWTESATPLPPSKYAD